MLTEETFFRDYVVHYTNAATLVAADSRDTEDLDGVFSGLNERTPRMVEEVSGVPQATFR